MAFPTFYNLPAEKRKRIVESALDEFSSFHYDKTSVNRIIRNAGIAKGSFYQYFENKDDLYAYCLLAIYECLLAKRVAESDWSLRELRRATAHLGSEAMIIKHQERIAEVVGERGLRFVKSIIHAPKHVRRNVLLQAATTLFMPIIKAELAEEEELREGIDLDHYAFLLSVGDFLAFEYTSMNKPDSDKLDEYALAYMSAIYKSMLKDGAD